MNFSFLPTLPFTLSYPLLFGVLLVAGMLGGEIARMVRVPRIIGYVVVGFLLAPFTQAMGMDSLIDEARIFVDLALGLVLFDLGRRMDLKWMKRDWTIAACGFAESLLAFFAVLAALLAFRFDPVKAGLAAAIAMTTSPAVLMLIVHDSASDGQVTERAMNLTALNGLLSSILVTILLGSEHYEAQSQVEIAILQPLYLFLGSLGLGAAVLPMSSLALLMQHDIARLFPDFGTDLSAILLEAILVMEIAGPFVVRWGLRFAGDVLPADPAATTRMTVRIPSAPGD